MVNILEPRKNGIFVVNMSDGIQQLLGNATYNHMF